MKTVADIQHCLFINLAARTDRLKHINTELPELGITKEAIRRFPAICLPKKPGSSAISCSMSHLKCIELAKYNGWPHVLVVEDDIQFLDKPQFRTSFQQFMTTYNKDPTEPAFDVLLVAGNNVPPYTQPHPFCARVRSCQTTTGYLVLAHYYDKLIENFKTGITNLMRDPEVRVGQRYTEYQLKYSIDKWWWQLQAADRWFLLTPLTVTQLPGKSDIEERDVNYTDAMLDISKQRWFRNGWVGRS